MGDLGSSTIGHALLSTLIAECPLSEGECLIYGSGYWYVESDSNQNVSNTDQSDQSKVQNCSRRLLHRQNALVTWKRSIEKRGVGVANATNTQQGRGVPKADHGDDPQGDPPPV